MTPSLSQATDISSDWKGACFQPLLQSMWRTHALEPWIPTLLYKVRDNPGNMKIKDETKQGHQPLVHV